MEREKHERRGARGVLGRLDSDREKASRNGGCF
jgi:hypothetical protein